MKYSKIPAAQSVVHHCKARGIKHIVISPGSRNAPLTIGFTEDPFFSCYSIVDERCAAFFALGLAQQLTFPVAVVCTSGSALLNYYPAVAEAFYSNLPLVVISADRPPEKIDIGDGQTIRQDGVFEKHIGYSANLRLDSFNPGQNRTDEPSPIGTSEFVSSEVQKDIQEYNDKELNYALRKVVASQCPVHINVPFEEPLYETVERASVISEVNFGEQENKDSPDSLEGFSEIWNTAKRKLILVGVHAPNKIEQQFLDELAEDPSVLVFTETTSNIHHPNFFPSIDSIIAPIEKSEAKVEFFRKLQPEVLLTFGGMIVSKKVKAFLRNYNPKHHWHVNPFKANNTFFCLSHHFKTDINPFLHRFLELTKEVESDYYKSWEKVKQRYESKREIYLKQIPFSDFSAFHTVQSSIPPGYQIQLANSSTIRYTQLFDLHQSLSVFCNRGTSGIDGSTSTAIGASLLSETPTLLITGDLSFLYDSNALWNDQIRNDFRIIVINNEGGGIFRILAGKENTEGFEKYFETTQNLQLERLCELYEIEYSMAESEKRLTAELASFYGPSKTPRLLEIRTPRTVNDKILLTYFDFLS